MGKYLYIYVEDDKYELPIAIADSSSELSRMLGLSRSYVTAAIKDAERNNVWCQFQKIPKEGDYRLPPETRREDKKAVKVVCNERVFRSLTDAAKEYNTSLNSIYYWLKKGVDSEGNSWRYF